MWKKITHEVDAENTPEYHAQTAQDAHDSLLKLARADHQSRLGSGEEGHVVAQTTEDDEFGRRADLLEYCSHPVCKRHNENLRRLGQLAIRLRGGWKTTHGDGSESYSGGFPGA